MGDIYTNPPQSRNEAILKATIDGTEYTAPPQSRIEDLLVELKTAIEEGGGGSVTSYNSLTNKPSINEVTLSGDKSTEDIIPIDDGLEFDNDGKLKAAIGDGLEFSNGAIEVSTAGGIEIDNGAVKAKVGDGLTINNDGEIETTGSYIPTTEKGAASGVATLNEAGKVPEAQLPSYVDDVIEGYLYEGAFYADAQHTEEITGEQGKIYVDVETNRSYRWSGSVFVEIGDNRTFTPDRKTHV